MSSMTPIFYYFWENEDLIVKEVVRNVAYSEMGEIWIDHFLRTVAMD